MVPSAGHGGKTVNEDRFKNRKEALDWLQSRGQISQGKFYQDCDGGMITIGPDKTVSKYQVMEYAEKVFGYTRQTGPTMDMALRKERLEIEKLEMEVEKRKLENRKDDEKWLLKEDAWAQLAALIGTLRDSLRHQFHVGQSHLVHLAGGDHQRGPELYEGCEELLARAFNEVCNAGHIEAVFEEVKE